MARILQNNFTGGLLSNVLWGRTDLNKYTNGLEECINFVPQVYGGIKTRPGMRYIGGLDDLVDGQNCRLIPFTFNAEQSYVLVFTHLKMRIIKDGGFVVYPAGHINEGEVVEIVTPYTEENLYGLRYTQISDTLYIASSSYGSRKLQRTDHHEWAFSLVSCDEISISAPTGISAVPQGDPSDPFLRVYTYTVTAVTPEGIETLITPSSAIYAGAYVESPWPAGFTITVSWEAQIGAEYYRVYKDAGNGLGYIGETTGVLFVDDNIRPLISNSLTRSRISDIAYPYTVGLYQQRMFYGGWDHAPARFIASNIALLDNFHLSGRAEDTDALDFTLYSNMSERIEHFVSLEKLIILTNLSEKIVTARDGSSSITPTDINIKTRGNIGCSRVKPMVIGSDLIFVQREGRRIYSLFYSLEADGFDSNELTMLVPDILDGDEVLDWVWDAAKSIIWLVTEAGSLLSLTYDRKQQVWAWSSYETDGKILGISNDLDGRVYLATQRHKVVSGSDVSTFQIERLYEGDRSSPKTSFCVDSGLIYSGSPVTTLSGLDHLIGREVAILADGGVENLQVVDGGGSITLEAPASEVIIGLPFSCIARPTRLNVNAGVSTTQTALKKISHVSLRVINARGLTVSHPNDGRRMPIEVKPRRDEPYAEPSELENGDVRLATFGSWGREGYIELRQDNPLPAHITAIVSEVEIED